MEDGHYVITFKNATTKFYGTISGNTLFLHDEGGKVLLIFEAEISKINCKSSAV